MVISSITLKQEIHDQYGHPEGKAERSNTGNERGRL